MTAQMPAADRPPQAPPLGRRLELPLAQWIGMPIILLVPALALFGVFGAARGTITRSRGALEMRVDYPSRFHYGLGSRLTLTVRNRASSAIDTIRVAFDTAYVSRFAGLSFAPAVDRAFEVPLTHVRPGETRLVAVGMLGDRYGRHEGRVVAWAGADTVEATIRTIIFP